ncbi:restriction endonuclease subunit S [Glaesserella parasuis]|uniref:restriction endonuclease subunit S n=1 Tax=Glaesserella parasuis TaxID=738 RepID=UPI00243651F4|nr:restriction endonuclease subunit S [Glaesserella parasuis]MDG6474229.1 restriction endonuclease subunit S [Glaesserella parasuis]MDO9799609.1 restriction endonuclease subunit S [Glaesserella parasuis]MDO9851574.1 restriction endonuclease subunit S [Glaesserella parasuis]MDO9865142.1 restriction endonuclease subunit S [Glaesserella parasuis]MDO9882799.1 restriction endonuclease subunit S [Glaesserella parasuis]
MSSLKCRLGDIAHIVMGQSPSGDEVNTQYLGFPLLNGPSEFTEFYPIPVQYTECGRKFAEQGDLLFCVRGSTTGKMNMADQKYAIGRGLAAISGKNGYSTEYIKIILEQNLEKILQSATGSTFPNVGRDLLCNLEVAINSVDVAENISQISVIINKKIQLNTQINQTLEQIAQTIFKSWFIDFDPVHAKAEALANGQTVEQATQATMAVISGKNSEELHRLQTANPEQYQQLWEIAEAFPSGVDEEGVPWGWGYEKSENLFDVGIGKTPPRKEPEWFSENSNDIEWISIKDMGNSEVFVNKSSEYLLESAVNKFNVKRIPENTVILSFKLTVGRVGITTKETTTNEAIAHFRLCEKSYLTTEFLYLYLKNFDFNNLGSTSSIATAVNSKTIKEMEILYPTLEIINVFQYRVSDIFKTIRANSEQRNCLEKIRDELLPKLLSGELNGLPEKAI